LSKAIRLPLAMNQLLEQLRKKNNAPDNAPAAGARLVYHLKPGLHYQYGFEMTSGDDGKGPWHSAGNISYELENAARTLSVMERAKRQQAGPGKGEFRVSYMGSVTTPRYQQNDMAMGTASIAPDGEILSVDGQSDYSMIAASASDLVFAKLPTGNAKKWKATRHRTGGFIDETLIRSPNDALGRFTGFNSLGRSGFSNSLTIRQTVLTAVGIEDQFDFELTESNKNDATIKCQLTSTWTLGDKTLGNVGGEGKYTFDPAQGVFTNYYGSYKLRFGANGIEATVPFQLAFTLNDALTSDEIKARNEKNRRETEERIAKTQSEVAASNLKQSEETDSKVKDAIATLKNSNASPEAISAALRALSSAGIASRYMERVPSARRDEVAKLLNPQIKSNVEQTRSDALRAAEYWATSANIPTLLEALQGEDRFERSTIMRALGATGGNEKVATMLARMLDTNSKFEAAMALKKMKSYAEAAVLPMLQSTDPNTLREVCDILGEVGGKRSRAALETLVNKSGKDDLDSFAVKQALDRVKERAAVHAD
jgi:hypothetical protein